MIPFKWSVGLFVLRERKKQAKKKEKSLYRNAKFERSRRFLTSVRRLREYYFFEKQFVHMPERSEFDIILIKIDLIIIILT